MNLHYFLILILFIINVKISNCSLLSRLKNFNTYQQDGLDIDSRPMTLRELKRFQPQLYDDLMEEDPLLEKVLEMRRKNKTQKDFYFPPPEPSAENDDDYYDDDINNEDRVVYHVQSHIDRMAKTWWSKGNSTWNKVAHLFRTRNNRNDTRRRFTWWQYVIRNMKKKYEGTWMSSCYECGPYWIPRSRLCHDAFDSQNGQARTLARYFRMYCYYNKWNWGHYRYYKWGWKSSAFYDILGPPRDTCNPITDANCPEQDSRYVRDRGNPRYDYYRGYVSTGCVKRFLDVGGIYTQRGCKSWPPVWTNQYDSSHLYPNRKTNGYAYHRYKKLEMILGKYPKKERCIYSPAASLTPFARGISLFARYHVCVCFGEWCNDGSKLMPTKKVLILVILALIYSVY